MITTTTTTTLRESVVNGNAKMLTRISRRSKLTLSIFFLTFNFVHREAETFEPITTGLIVGSALVGAGYKQFIHCRIFECCDDAWIKVNISGSRLFRFFCSLLTLTPANWWLDFDKIISTAVYPANRGPSIYPLL